MPVLLYKMEKGKEMPTLFTMRSMPCIAGNLGSYFLPDYGFLMEIRCIADDVTTGWFRFFKS